MQQEANKKETGTSVLKHFVFCVVGSIFSVAPFFISQADGIYVQFI